MHIKEVPKKCQRSNTLLKMSSKLKVTQHNHGRMVDMHPSSRMGKKSVLRNSNELPRCGRYRYVFMIEKMVRYKSTQWWTVQNANSPS